MNLALDAFTVVGIMNCAWFVTRRLLRAVRGEFRCPTCGRTTP